MFAPSILLVLCLLAGAVFPASASASNALVPPGMTLYRVRYAHIVVECTIKDVSTRTVAYPGENSTRNYNTVRLTDVVRLRGNAAPREVAVDGILDPAALVGKRMILCAYWLGGREEMYFVPSRDAAFRREDDRWLQLPDAVGAIPVRATDSEIHAIVQEYEIPSLTRVSDQVVIGRVVSVIDSSLVIPGQEPCDVQKVVLRVERQLKGVSEGRYAWFLVARLGSSPSWKTVTPSQFLVDEEWVAFLKRDGDIYYPLGGVNGLLQLRGQEVIYDRKVKHRYNKSYLVREVLRSVDD